MSSLFAFLSATREELIELHRALLRQYVLENSLRKEQGLETVERTMILEKLETLLQITEEEAHGLLHHTEDELWEYCWYTYTDEWAWYRAKKDVIKELRESAQTKSDEELEILIEQRYEKKFEKYVGEVDMQEEPNISTKHSKRARAPKKK